MKLMHEFIHDETAPHRFPYQIGKYVATPLSGFIAGTVFASIVWFLGIYLIKLVFGGA